MKKQFSIVYIDWQVSNHDFEYYWYIFGNLIHWLALSAMFLLEFSSDIVQYEVLDNWIMIGTISDKNSCHVLILIFIFICAYIVY